MTPTLNGFRRCYGDLRSLYGVASPKEKAELLQLMFKRITFHGPDRPAELFDRRGIEIRREGGGSILTKGWLPMVDEFRTAVVEMSVAA